MGNTGKNLLIWLTVLGLLIIAYDVMQGSMSGGKPSRLAFSDFLTKVEENNVTDVVIQGRKIEGHLEGGIPFSTYAPDYPFLVDKLAQHKTKIQAAPSDEGAFWSIFFSFGPTLLLVGVYVFFMRQMQSGTGRAMGFGKSRARLMSEKGGKITFEDVAGVDEAKEELEEIVDFLKDPGKFQKLGGKIPKGCLLIGSPGTGKTLLARAIAGEANVPFFSISGSDFVEMFVGVGASRVRDMFEQGKRNAPCIIFIDEIDAVGRHRGQGHGGGNDEREQTLNQLLVEMDGFEDNDGVIILAATNRPDVLDPALLRPGRFDRQITVSAPDINGREKILLVHLKKLPLGPDVVARIIARGTPGFSGADLANLVNEAALLAARRNKKIVTMHHLEEAKDKVLMGVERKSMVMSEEEKLLTAYHEAGHAIIAFFSEASAPIHKATIIPRGRALGMVMRLPEGDRHSVTRDELEADMAVAMGGRVAEEIIFGHGKVTSGASSDIQKATSIARSMVIEWGMSEKVGPLYHGNDHREGGYYGNNKKISDDTAHLIDTEIKAIIDHSYQKARSLLTEKNNLLHLLAKTLLVRETLTGDEIKILLTGGTLHPLNDNMNPSPPLKKSSILSTPEDDESSFIPPLKDEN